MLRICVASISVSMLNHTDVACGFSKTLAGDGGEGGGDQNESRNEIETDGTELSVLDLFIWLD